MFKHLTLLLILCPLLTFAKDYEVKIRVKNLPADSKPLLLRIYNGDLFILDSLPDLKQEEVTFHIPETTNPGMFRGILGMSSYAAMRGPMPIKLDFIFNKEDIELQTDYLAPQDSLRVIRSKENKIYADFAQSDAIFFQKLGLLEQVVQNYPDEDEFYQKALSHYLKFQNERNKFIDKTYKTHPKTLAAKIIKNQKMPVLPGKVTAEERDSLAGLQYLGQVDFTDTTLLFTNVYTDKVYRFIQMNMKPNLTPRENEANCIRALDQLVPLLAANPTIQQHLLQFLIAGFESMGMEEVLAHISSNYMQQCGTNSETIKRRLEGYRKMAVGKKVPDLTATDIAGNTFNLYNSIQPYTLLLFWHSECGHCQMLMDALPKLSKSGFFNDHQVQIVGISIDEHKEEWEKYSENYSLDWINTRVEGSFGSTVAADYNLFATPTMFLIDSEHNIIAKPLTFEELKDNITQLK